MRYFIGYVHTDWSDETNTDYEITRFSEAPDEITLSGKEDILRRMCEDLCEDKFNYFREAYKHISENDELLTDEAAFDLFVEDCFERSVLKEVPWTEYKRELDIVYEE